MGLIIEYYLFFCLVTSITGLLQIYTPIHRRLQNEVKDNKVSKHPVVSYVTLFILGFLTAPLVLILLLSNKSADVFIESMFDALKESK